MTDIVKCRWVLPCQNERHRVEFHHGAASGRRSLMVDGKTIQCRNRSGDEKFKIEEMEAKICITKVDARNFEYSLTIDGVSFETFRETQNRRYDRWETESNKTKYEVVFDKVDLKVRANGIVIRTYHKFEEDAITDFEIENLQCRIVAKSSGKQRIGVIHSLYVNKRLEPLILDETPGLFKSKLPIKS